jgi:hypothetical protein
MIKKSNLLRDKRGAITLGISSNVWLTSILAGILILLLIFSSLLAYCGSIGPFKFGFTDQPSSYEKMQDQITGPGLIKYYYKSIYWTADKLGFNTGYSEVKSYGSCLGFVLHSLKTTGGFLFDLIIGFLAGLWIYSVSSIYRFIKRFNPKASIGSQWMLLIAGKLWMVIAIAFGYAVIMQIPIINRAIEIITFEVLGVNFFIRSFIIAFYIGFGPAWIESYQKYRLRIKAEKAILYAKTAAKLEQARAGG